MAIASGAVAGAVAGAEVGAIASVVASQVLASAAGLSCLILGPLVVLATVAELMCSHNFV